jgi:hypothetical protein
MLVSNKLGLFLCVVVYTSRKETVSFFSHILRSLTPLVEMVLREPPRTVNFPGDGLI